MIEITIMECWAQSLCRGLVFDEKGIPREMTNEEHDAAMEKAKGHTFFTAKIVMDRNQRVDTIELRSPIVKDSEKQSALEGLLKCVSETILK